MGNPRNAQFWSSECILLEYTSIGKKTIAQLLHSVVTTIFGKPRSWHNRLCYDKLTSMMKVHNRPVMDGQVCLEFITLGELYPTNS